MIQTTRFIAGDWGTSNLRLYLCEYKLGGGSQIIDSRNGPGISQIKKDFETLFFELTQDWFNKWGDLRVLLSGMIGSTLGWKEVPYLSCPIDAAQIAKGSLNFEARRVSFSILAGLKTQNPLSAPDVMRGEELQILGWLRSNKQDSGRTLFALPGTHNKWALVENGVITNFLTAFTGELYSLLCSQSILVVRDRSDHFSQTSFITGVRAIEASGNAELLHLLFTTRSKQVVGEMASEDAQSYLSGLIVGADVLGAIKLFNDVDSVTIIGEPILSAHYQTCLNHIGIANQSCDPADIAVAGFDAVFEHLIENK